MFSRLACTPGIFAPEPRPPTCIGSLQYLPIWTAPEQRSVLSGEPPMYDPVLGSILERTEPYVTGAPGEYASIMHTTARVSAWLTTRSPATVTGPLIPACAMPVMCNG